MEKLSVVVPSNEVEVEGAKYRKVERKAQAGDIVKITDDGAPSYIISGAFYEVKRIDSFGDPRIMDEDGDEWDTCGNDYEVYEKVAEPATVEYREVNRKAEKGERIRIVNLRDDRYSTGDEFVVSEVAFSGDVVIMHPKHGRVCVINYEYVVLEPLNVAKRSSVGDYVTVIANTSGHRYVIGSVVKIVVDDHDSIPYQAERSDGTTGNWLKEAEVIPATEAEFNAQKRFKVGEFAKVVGPNDNGNNYEIGSVVEITECDPDSYSNVVYKAKKPDGSTGNYVREYQLVRTTKAELDAQKPQPVRLKIGDYAKITDTFWPVNGDTIGDIVEILDYEGGHPNSYGIKFVKDGAEKRALAKHLVRATESEVEAAKKALERTKNIGEFADGGYAVVKSDADGYLSGGYRGAYVKVRPTLTEGPYALEISLSEQRGYSGYCNADALRKVSREEYEEATNPKPAFNVGDYAKVIRDNHEHRVGHIVKITEGTSRIFDFAVKRITYGGNGYIDAKNIEKVSAEEVARIEEEAKWAAIDRKVGEYKRGDIVEAKQYSGRGEQIYGKVEDVGREGELLGLRLPNGRYNVVYVEGAKLIVPVEQRFDRAEGGASTSK